MASKKAASPKTNKAPKAAPTRLVLNEAGLKAARSSLDDGAVTPHNNGPWVKDIIAERLLGLPR